MPRTRYNDMQILDKARAFYKKYGRVPTSAELGLGFAITVRKRIGSWEKYIQLALGKKAKRHCWDNEELLTQLRLIYKTKSRFPVQSDLSVAAAGQIKRRFNSIDIALEFAIGNSPRLEVLRSIEELTPPGCNEATIGEICSTRRIRDLGYDARFVASRLYKLEKIDYVQSGKYDTKSWYRLTHKGRSFLRDWK